MHIAEGYLPPLHCVAWFAASAPFVVHGTRKLVEEMRERPENRLFVAAAGAFTLVLSAIKLPSFSGSSSHPTGTGLGAVLFRPPIMAALSTVVLIFQALLLAHGGLTTLGANVFSMGIAGPWCGYGAFVLARRLRLPVEAAVFGAMAVADLSTYVVTAGQLAVAHPDASGGLPVAFAKFLGLFALTQIPLAVVEGLLGVVVYRFLAKAAPDDLARVGLVAGSRAEAARA